MTMTTTKNYAATTDGNGIELTKSGTPVFETIEDGSYLLYTGEIVKGSVADAFAASKAAYVNGEAPAPVQEPTAETSGPARASSGARFVRKGGKGGQQWYAPEAGRLFPTRAQAIAGNEAAFASKGGSPEGDATGEPTHTTSGALRVKRNNDGTYYAPEARQRFAMFWDAVHANEAAYAEKAA